MYRFHDGPGPEHFIANNAIDEAINNPRIVFSNVDLCEVYGPDSIDVKQEVASVEGAPLSGCCGRPSDVAASV